MRSKFKSHHEDVLMGQNVIPIDLDLMLVKGNRLSSPQTWLPSRKRPRRTARALRCSIDNRFVLKPAGDGSTEHIGRRSVPSTPEFILTPGVFELGREAPADLIIPIPTVSGRHALLRITDQEVTVTDLESTNGTYIDREELQPMRAMPLNLGSEVIFGDEHLALFILLDDGEGGDVSIAEPEIIDV